MAPQLAHMQCCFRSKTQLKSFWFGSCAEPDAEVAELDAVDMDGVGAEWGDDLQLVGILG